MPTVIRVENLSKSYRLGQIGTGTFTNDLKIWWARRRGKPNPLLKIGQVDPGNSTGEELWALKDVSFAVEQGEVLGIIGRNGAGKSTLLKILSRVTAPTSGIVKVKGRIASLLEVGTGFHPELTGRENIFLNGAILGMTRTEIKSKFDEIVDFAEIEKFIDTPVKRYSSGMYVRLAFAVAAHLEPEILLVDEVLAVGDAEFQKKCLGKMGDVAHAGRTVLFVSHNMAAIRKLCHKGLVFNRGEVHFLGKVEDAVFEYEDLTSRIKSISEFELSENIIYRNFIDENDRGAADFENYRIEMIEILDEQDHPKSKIQTWDFLKFRIYFWAKENIKKGSMVLQLSTILGEPIAILSTQPDSNIPMEIKKGHHSIDCMIHRLPLSAGKFILGCGLAIPKKEYLCWDEKLAHIIVHERDVFGSGLAPKYPRSLIALSHEWLINK